MIFTITMNTSIKAIFNNKVEKFMGKNMEDVLDVIREYNI